MRLVGVKFYIYERRNMEHGSPSRHLTAAMATAVCHALTEGSRLLCAAGWLTFRGLSVAKASQLTVLTLSMCIYIHVCACGCLCSHTWVSVCTWNPEDNLGCHSLGNEHPPSFFETGSLIVQAPPCLHLSSHGVQAHRPMLAQHITDLSHDTFSV